MLYTFLIATRRQKLAAFKNSRPVRVIASTETEARNHLKGLPLVFVSRTPAGGAQ